VRNARHRYRAAAHPRENAGAAVQAVFSLTKSGLAFAKTADGTEYFIPERFRGWPCPGTASNSKPFRPSRRARAAAGAGAGGQEGRAIRPGAQAGRGGDQGAHAGAHPMGGPIAEGRQGQLLRRAAGELELGMELLPDGVDAAAKPGDWIVVGAPGLDLGGKEPTASRFLSRLGGDDTPTWTL